MKENSTTIAHKEQKPALQNKKTEAVEAYHNSFPNMDISFGVEQEDVKSFKSSVQAHNLSQISIFPNLSNIIQPKLKINSPGNKYEQEADSMANQVMSMSTTFIQHKHIGSAKNEQGHIQQKPLVEQISTLSSSCLAQCKSTKCEEEEKQVLQTKSNTGIKGKASNNLTNQVQQSQGSGLSMDNDTKSFMESRFGVDFSNVRIHTNSTAHNMNQEINARAFTVANNIYFNRGQYNPKIDSGKKLLAHELTHVIQQNGNHNSEFAQRSVDEDEITGGNPRFSFSTRCGWIDWSHATDGMTRHIIPAIQQVSDNMRASGTTTPQPVTTPTMESRPGGILLSGVTPTFNIKRPLSSDEIRSVALRVFMLQSIAFENLQQWTDFIGESSFSAEDLPSNLIGFYMGVDNLDRDDIRTICDVWSPEDSLSEFQNNEPSSRNRTFRPLRSSHTTGWPTELSGITPAVIGGPLIDEPMGALGTFGAATTINLAHYNDLFAGNYSLISVTGSNTIDISSEESSSSAGNHFEINGLPASHNFVFRWNILDDNDNAYAMWSDHGSVHYYGNANNAYIGSRTRALLRERNITSVRVNCRIAIDNARQYNQVFRLRVNLTW